MSWYLPVQLVVAVRVVSVRVLLKVPSLATPANGLICHVKKWICTSAVPQTRAIRVPSLLAFYMYIFYIILLFRFVYYVLVANEKNSMEKSV